MTIILPSFSVDKQTVKTDFEIKVEKFINGLKTDFEESPERFLNSKHNDFTLETKTNSTWNKTLMDILVIPLFQLNL